jgi:uncharacterized repeat protein (TIGR04138 family)
VDQLADLAAHDKLAPEVLELVQRLGGTQELNRHISGQTLCWGLRNYALEKYGALASAVLYHWNIRRTQDFGVIVFALVENDFLQKQPQDTIHDFEDVFQFDDAFDRTFRITLKQACQQSRAAAHE